MLTENKNLNNSSRAQLLIEALVALGILTSSFLGILGLISQSISLNRAIADQYTASYLAAEGIEIVKNVVDQNEIDVQSGNTNVSFNTNLSGDKCFEVEYTQIGNVQGFVSKSFIYKSFSYPSSFSNSDIIGYFQKLSNNIDYLDFDSTNHSYYYISLLGASQTQTPFKRVVCVSSQSSPSSPPTEITINSLVYWVGQGGVPYVVNLEDHFYNWRQQTTQK